MPVFPIAACLMAAAVVMCILLCHLSCAELKAEHDFNLNDSAADKGGNPKDKSVALA